MQKNKPDLHDFRFTHNGKNYAVGQVHDVDFEVKCVVQRADDEWDLVAQISGLDEKFNRNLITPTQALEMLFEKVNSEIFDANSDIPPHIVGKFLELALLIRDGITYSPTGLSLS